MTTSELGRLCQAILPGIRQTGAFIMGEMGKISATQIDTKSLNSLVSYVDKEAEKQLVKLLGKALPEAGFLTEEETVATSNDKMRWIIDPLDGTTNFLHQLPFFSISIALEKEGQMILVVVYECNRAECFYAWKNGGAYLNEKPIKISTCPDLKDSLLATGFPYFTFGQLDTYLEVLAYFVQHTRGVRRLGSAALDLAYVACGRFDGFFESNLNTWDVAAGVVLIKEAGGTITDFSLEDRAHEGKEILASNGALHDQMYRVVKKLV